MFSFPPATWMFRFAGFASIFDGCHASAWRVAPFGHLRISGRSRLPADFRGLPRPSSPPGAKASPVRLASLLALACHAAAFTCRAFARVSFVFVSAFTFPSCQRTAHALSHASVENVGLEPTTPGLQSRCSSQLSQSPAAPMVVPGRLELPTPTLSVWCSNRLSYGTPLSGVPGTRPLSRLASPSLVFPASTGTLRNCVTSRRPLQKGGVPAAPSGTATLLRLSPSHHVRPRRGATPGFRRPRLPWLDGRCVQGPGTYSPRHG